MSDGTAVAEPRIVRTPNSMVALLDLRTELTDKISKARNRLVRANRAIETFEARLVDVNDKIGSRDVNSPEVKADAQKRFASLQAQLAALHAQFNL